MSNEKLHYIEQNGVELKLFSLCGRMGCLQNIIYRDKLAIFYIFFPKLNESKTDKVFICVSILSFLKLCFTAI